jgi:menaquinone-specific isochorismate synthase
MDVPAQPSVMGLRNVSHLATHITGTLAASGSRPSALELVARVHPTPAVGGTPTDTAIKYLQSVEGFDRGCYAGPVGWVDGRGDGAWAIGIRSAVVSGVTAQLYAGNGIVAGSDPEAELAETQLKLQALLAALVRP